VEFRALIIVPLHNEKLQAMWAETRSEIMRTLSLSSIPLVSMVKFVFAPLQSCKVIDEMLKNV
jgi:hypothetical protein